MTAHGGPASREADADGDTRPSARGNIVLVHRIGAALVAIVIGAIGVLGFAGGLGFFDTEGAPVLGLSTNGALSSISVITALVLVAAAIRGGRFASTVLIVVGALFLVSAFVNLALLETSLNLLAFRLPNVFFSIGAGLVLLVLGAYGRVSGTLPDDNPYRLEDGGTPEQRQSVDRQPRPSGPEEAAADAAMAEAERSVVAGAGSAEQRRRVEEIGDLRTQEDRRERWQALEDGRE